MDQLHQGGPKGGEILEKLSLCKKIYPEIFSLYEERIISTLGLFYKNTDPRDLYSFLLLGFGQQYKTDFGAFLTPVQASVRRAVDENEIISISAPTSAGKSYSIRDFIADMKGDAVIVVPSRALIAEYVNTMRSKFKDRKRHYDFFIC